jgi:beta-glucosidase
MLDYNIRNGRTYMYFKQEALYPFGFGLSYTSFNYSNLKVIAKNALSEGEIAVSVNVSNTGKRAGDEVVQLYVSHQNSRVERPMKELKGFQRISIPAGETKTVQIILKKKDLAYWDKSAGGLMVEKDKIKLMIGASSTDIKLSEVIDIN